MKKIYLIILIVLTSLKMYAQPWAQPGATWYYNINPNGGGVTGYVKITKTGDTLIQSHLCDILEKRRVGYQYSPFYQSFDTVYGYEFTYTQNNVVYIWRNNVFFTLYDFNAIAGDGWIVPACQFGIGSPCGDSGSVSITQTGIVNLSGQNLQYLTVVTDSGSMYGFSDINANTSTIIEKIGNTLSFIADFSGGCIVDANEMYGLRCYFDSSGYYYNTGLVTNCDDLTGINENISAAKFNIFPNPASTEFQISNFTFQSGDELIFSDVTGKILFTKKITAPTLNFKLETLNFSNGIYFLQLKTKDGVVNKKVVVEH